MKTNKFWYLSFILCVMFLSACSSDSPVVLVPGTDQPESQATQPAAETTIDEEEVSLDYNYVVSTEMESLVSPEAVVADGEEPLIACMEDNEVLDFNAALVYVLYANQITVSDNVAQCPMGPDPNWASGGGGIVEIDPPVSISPVYHQFNTYPYHVDLSAEKACEEGAPFAIEALGFDPEEDGWLGSAAFAVADPPEGYEQHYVCRIETEDEVDLAPEPTVTATVEPQVNQSQADVDYGAETAGLAEAYVSAKVSVFPAAGWDSWIDVQEFVKPNCDAGEYAAANYWVQAPVDAGVKMTGGHERNSWDIGLSTYTIPVFGPTKEIAVVWGTEVIVDGKNYGRSLVILEADGYYNVEIFQGAYRVGIDPGSQMPRYWDEVLTCLYDGDWTPQYHPIN